MRECSLSILGRRLRLGCRRVTCGSYCSNQHIFFRSCRHRQFYRNESTGRRSLRCCITLQWYVCGRSPQGFLLNKQYYPDLLKDETSDIDLVSPTFASLKAILSIPVLKEADSQDRYQRAIHALLSSCLLNIDEMRYAFILSSQ